jgi:hypothetical protein
MLVDERSLRSGWAGSSSRAKYALAAFRISFARRNCLTSRPSSCGGGCGRAARPAELERARASARGSTEELLERGVRLVFESGRPIAQIVGARAYAAHHGARPDQHRSWHETEFLSRGPKSSVTVSVKPGMAQGVFLACRWASSRGLVARDRGARRCGHWVASTTRAAGRVCPGGKAIDLPPLARSAFRGRGDIAPSRCLRRR